MYMERNMNGPTARVQVVRDERESFKARAVDSLILRSGYKVESPAPGYEEFRRSSLRDLAKACLRQRGKNIPNDDSKMIGRALTSSDLPYLMIDTINRTFLRDFQE
jgi:hypothetical protein